MHRLQRLALGLASCSLVTVIESSCAEIQIYVNLQAFNAYGSNCLPIHTTDWIEIGSIIHHHIRKGDIVPFSVK
jgi:hypothetical protein